MGMGVVVQVEAECGSHGSVGGGCLRGSGVEGKGANVNGGEVSGIFFQFEFRLRNGVGRTLAWQNFRITHLTSAEMLASFCTMRNKNKV